MKRALPAAGGIVTAHPAHGHADTLRRRPASPQACFLAFVITCTLLLTISLATKNFWPSQPVATIAKLPPSSDYYLAYSLGGIEDYMVFHGMSGIPARLKAADVLLVGNSHTQFGFPRQTLAPFFAARHLNYYNLGFGYTETSAFPLAIIKKFDLHPKWLIVNVEPFFSNQPSGMAAAAMADTMFDGVKFRLETAGAFYGERYLHRLVPTLAHQFPAGDEVYFRSTLDGNVWLGASAETHEPPVALVKQWQSALPAAIEFKKAMDHRGVRMVFTHTPVSTDDAVRGLSAALGGVPIVEADNLPGLFTFDGSHLEHGSAVRFSQSFLNHLAPVIDRK